MLIFADLVGKNFRSAFLWDHYYLLDELLDEVLDELLGELLDELLDEER